MTEFSVTDQWPGSGPRNKYGDLTDAILAGKIVEVPVKGNPGSVRSAVVQSVMRRGGKVQTSIKPNGDGTFTLYMRLAQ